MTTTIPSPVTTNGTGGFSAVFKVPASTVGLKKVAATDQGLNSDTALFEVTDANPPIAPLKTSNTNQQQTSPNLTPSTDVAGGNSSTKFEIPF